jgi:hypothetical protein
MKVIGSVRSAAAQQHCRTGQGEHGQRSWLRHRAYVVNQSAESDADVKDIIR